MKASSGYNIAYHAYNGRLNGDRGLGAWCPKTKTDRRDYLQVDMGTVRSVCAVATQGLGYGWTTSYKLFFSSDGVIYNTFKEMGAEKVSEFTE